MRRGFLRGDGMELHRITISPNPISSTIGAEVQLEATGEYTDGSTANLTSAVTWSVEDSVASVTNGTNGGVLTMLTGGDTVVHASFGGKIGIAELSVDPNQPMFGNISLGYQANEGVPAFTWVVPFFVPDDVTQVKIHISNRNSAQGVGNGAAHGATVTGLNVGVGASNGSFGYANTPVTYLNQTIPDNAGEYVTPWIPITRGADGKILVVWGVQDAGQEILTTSTSIKYGKYVFSAGGVVDPIPGGLADAPSIALTVNVEYGTSVRRVVLAGNSLAVGYNIDTTREDAAWYKMGVDQNWAVDSRGVPGSTLGQWSDPAERPYYFTGTDDELVNCDFIVEVGVNDLPLVDLAGYQARLATMVARAKAAGADRVWVMTPTPIVAYAAYEALRQSILTYLRAGGITDVDGIIDADAIIRDSGDHSIINPAFDTGDGHWNAAGHAAVEAETIAVLTA